MADFKILRMSVSRELADDMDIPADVYCELQARLAASLKTYISLSFLGDGRPMVNALTTHADPKPASLSAEDLFEKIRKAASIQVKLHPASEMPPLHNIKHRWPPDDVYGGLGALGAMRILVDPHAVRVTSRVRGIPAGRKPNRYRPYYRRVRVTVPLMYIMASRNAIVCHPTLEAEIRKRFTS